MTDRPHNKPLTAADAHTHQHNHATRAQSNVTVTGVQQAPTVTQTASGTTLDFSQQGKVAKVVVNPGATATFKF